MMERLRGEKTGLERGKLRQGGSGGGQDLPGMGLEGEKIGLEEGN